MASQRLTLGLVCRTLDVEPEALHTVKTLRLERLRLAALCPLDALAGSLRELYLRDNRLETLDCAEALAALAPHLAVLDGAEPPRGGPRAGGCAASACWTSARTSSRATPAPTSCRRVADGAGPAGQPFGRRA